LEHKGKELPLTFLTEFAELFTPRTWRRFLLLGSAILTTGPQTIANLLRLANAFACGHAFSYHRVLSHARRSGLRLACALTRFLLRHFWPAGSIPSSATTSWAA
jgi:hypothetical protein